MRTVEALDLHVLGTPPAFILSQDQTLKIVIVNLPFVHIMCVLDWRPSIVRLIPSVKLKVITLTGALVFV